jgi:hypothetical protein
MIGWILSKLVKVLNLPERVIKRDDVRPGRCYLRRYYLLGDGAETLRKYFPEGHKAPRWWQKPFMKLPLVYLHKFESSDEDEELHSHPWTATSLILSGGYLEERRATIRGAFPDGLDVYEVVRTPFRPGQINRLHPDTFHRVRLFGDECWTLIVVGDRVQDWGFWSPTTGEFEGWREHAQRKR